jgi:hypothetical protein
MQHVIKAAALVVLISLATIPPLEAHHTEAGSPERPQTSFIKIKNLLILIFP